MTKLLQTLMDGVSVGSLYALIALGYTMVYGILQFINFAHSDIFMLGAWGAFVIAQCLGLTLPGAHAPLWAAFAALGGAMALCGTMGFVIERAAYRPLRHAPRLNVLITAIGVSLLLENIGQLSFVFGTQPQRMPALFPDTTLCTVLGVQLRLVDCMVMGIAVTLMLGLQWLIFHTRVGRAMRAVSFCPHIAALMGISVDRIVSLTFVIGSMLAAAAGVLYAAKYPGLNQSAHPTWILLGLKAFVAAVVGGIGNVRGAMLGGLLIGVVELFGAAYLSPHLRDLYVFSLLIVMLLWRPQGLLAQHRLEKV